MGTLTSIYITLILRSSYFCRIWTLCVSLVTSNLFYLFIFINLYVYKYIYILIYINIYIHIIHIYINPLSFKTLLIWKLRFNLSVFLDKKSSFKSSHCLFNFSILKQVFSLSIPFLFAETNHYFSFGEEATHSVFDSIKF